MKLRPDQGEGLEEFVLGRRVDLFDRRQERLFRLEQVLPLRRQELQPLLLGRVLLERGEVDVPRAT